MARQPRIEYEGVIYHMMSRADRREAIFYDDANRVEFLRTPGQVCEKTDRLRMGSANYVSSLLLCARRNARLTIIRVAAS